MRKTASSCLFDLERLCRESSILNGPWKMNRDSTSYWLRNTPCFFRRKGAIQGILKCSTYGVRTDF